MPTGTINNIYNITDYFATYGGNSIGTGDCSNAIQHCIDEAQDGIGAGIGGTVYFPPGKYLIRSMIQVRDKTKFKLFCDGEILLGSEINSSGPNYAAFRLTNCKYCRFEGLKLASYYDNVNGVGVWIAAASSVSTVNCLNVFRNTQGDGLRNYLFVIENGSDYQLNPYDNTFDGIAFDGCYGVLKDICTHPTSFGRGVNVMNADGYASKVTTDPNYTNANFPALFWFRNIHDVYVDNVTGEHLFSNFVLEGDTNAHLHHLQISSYKNNSVILKKDSNNRMLQAVNLTDSYFWGIPIGSSNYTANYALEVSGCWALNAHGLVISNYDKGGILQKNTGYYVYSNIRFLDNVVGVEFAGFNAYDTFITFENIASYVDHVTTNRLYPQNTQINHTQTKMLYAQASVQLAYPIIIVRNSWLQASILFDVPSIPNNRIELYQCKLVGQGGTSAGIARNFPQFGNAPPTSGTNNVGDIVFNTNPVVGQYAGWICTVSGTPGTWKPFGKIDN